MRSTCQLQLVMLASLGVGCSSPIGVDQQPVINGWAFPGTDRLVQVNSNFGCTGTLVTPQWVLTAGHCLQGQPASNFTVILGKAGPSSRVDLIKTHPTGLDVMLLHLTTALAAPGFQSAMYTYSSDSLAGKPVELQGFGCNAVSTCNPYACTGGDGTMRAGELSGCTSSSCPSSWGSCGSSCITHDQYNVNYVGGNNVEAGGGDSGGPIWYFYNGVPYQTGVLKGSECIGTNQSNGHSFAATPETFEPWVFASIYGSPVPIPTTTACHNYSCRSGTGKGEWNLGAPNIPDFWERPLRANTVQCSAAFNPCPGSNNYYIWRGDWSLNGSDYIFVKTNYESDTLTGTSNQGYWGLGPMQICYGTGSNGSSLGMNWMDVMCDRGRPSESLVCHGARCRNTVDPLPPSSTQTVSWNPCGGGRFYYFINARTVAPDFVSVNGLAYSGNVNTYGVATGATPVSYSTGSTNNYSNGILSLYAVCAGW